MLANPTEFFHKITKVSLAMGAGSPAGGCFSYDRYTLSAFFQLEFIPDQFWIIILLIIVLLNFFVSCFLYPVTFTVVQRAVVFPLRFPSSELNQQRLFFSFCLDLYFFLF